MNEWSMTDRIYRKLRAFGLRSRIIPYEHVAEIREEFERKVAEGTIDAEVYSRYLTNMDFRLPDDLIPVRSVILIAAVQPKREIVFTVDGHKVSGIIPSTYDHEIDSLVTRILHEAMANGPYKIVRARLPLKLPAVRCGLAKYGRNNVAYVDGAGSFCRLMAFYTNLPATEDHWQEPQMLDQCADCNACAKRCPTGAISEDRFAVHAERCLSFFNESAEPIPDWVTPEMHHCLIGCTRCTDCCPVNKDTKGWVSTRCEFSREETSAILGAASGTSLHPEIELLLKRTNFEEGLELFPRNLRLLVDRPA